MILLRSLHCLPLLVVVMLMLVLLLVLILVLVLLVAPEALLIGLLQVVPHIYLLLENLPIIELVLHDPYDVPLLKEMMLILMLPLVLLA